MAFQQGRRAKGPRSVLFSYLEEAARSKAKSEAIFSILLA